MVNSVIINNNTEFKSLLERLFRMPLWVQQAIYCKLKKNIAESSDIEIIDKTGLNIIQLQVPKLNSNSQKLLKNNGIENINNRLFLESTEEALNLLEISHKNQWSLKKTCDQFLECIEKSYVEPLESHSSMDFLQYITEKIRLGEFLVRTGRITSMQLDKALYAKKCAEEFGDEVNFNEIIANLGYLNTVELNNITSIKDSASKTIGTIDDSNTKDAHITILQDEIDSLMFNNKRLEEETESLKTQLLKEKLEKMELQKQLTKSSKGVLGRLNSMLAL